MMCERYWRDGIVLVERGEDDPHRAACADCKLAHASRQELLEVLPLIGADLTSDPHWQAKVWRRIDEERAGARGRRPWRWRWQLAGALAVACVVALWIGRERTPPEGTGLPITIVPGGVAMRSASFDADDQTPISAHVGDRMRIQVRDTSDVWIYRGDRLELQCSARQVSPRCELHAADDTVEIVLSIAGTYNVLRVDAPAGPLPRGNLDEDLADLESQRIHHRKREVKVR
jgi:hypothetical protein